jgi:PAP2 superfamily
MAAYNLVLAVAWCTGLRWWPWAALLVAAHLAGTFVPRLIDRVQLPERGFAAVWRLYPLIYLAVFWAELGPLRIHLHAGAHDAFVQALDLAVFGRHLEAVWMPAMHGLLLSETMHLAYVGYYAAIVLPAVWVLATRGGEASADLLLRLMTTYVACYLIYLVFPVDGPSHLGPFYVGPNAVGPFYRLVHWIDGNAGVGGAAFPSSHAAGAVTIAIVARRYLRPAAVRLLWLEAVGVTLATFYTQYHYAIDALTGFLLAVVVQAWIVPLLAAGTARRKHAGAPPSRPVQVLAPIRDDDAPPTRSP